MSLLGGLVSGIFNIGSQSMANRANMHAVRENNELQRELAEYQWSKDLEMWNLQNHYNSPLSQMQRFKAAGLNPNLVYSQGNSGNASSMPSYQSPTTQAVTRNALKLSQFDGVLDILGKYQNIKIGQQQVQNMETSRNLAEVERLIKMDKNMRDWQLHPYNMDIKKEILEQTRSSIMKLREDTRYRKRENDFWEKYGIHPNGIVGQILGGGSRLKDFLRSVFRSNSESIRNYYDSKTFRIPKN